MANSLIPLPSIVQTVEMVSHQLLASTTVAGNSSTDLTTVTLTKSGYFPIGVVGFQLSSQYMFLTRLYLSSQGTGTGKVTFRIRNTNSNDQSTTLTGYVLWAKII